MSDRNNDDERRLLSNSGASSDQHQQYQQYQQTSQISSSSPAISQPQSRGSSIRSYGATNNDDISERASLLSPSSEGI